MSNRIIPEETRLSVIDYRLGGHTIQETADAFQVSPDSVKRWTKPHMPQEENTLQVHRNGAAKVAKKAVKPKASPVDISRVPRELRSQLPKDLTRVQILNATTVIVWNSANQRRKLQTKAAKEHRA